MRRDQQATTPRKRQNRGAVAARRGVVAAEPPAAPRTHTTRSGKTATLYNVPHGRAAHFCQDLRTLYLLCNTAVRD
jgi:hypothetical protein